MARRFPPALLGRGNERDEVEHEKTSQTLDSTRSIPPVFFFLDYVVIGCPPVSLMFSFELNKRSSSQSVDHIGDE